MAIEISPQTEARLISKAQAEGVSVGEYVERLVSEADARGLQLAEFRQALDERVASLEAGERVDGEEVMSRLIAELDAPGEFSSRR